MFLAIAVGGGFCYRVIWYLSCPVGQGFGIDVTDASCTAEMSTGEKMKVLLCISWLATSWCVGKVVQ
jgi:hypothetical protein